jgi:hypothetical protein
LRKMSTDAIRRRAAELGATFIGREEWEKILNAAEMPTRRLVIGPAGLGFTEQAELTEDEYRTPSSATRGIGLVADVR